MATICETCSRVGMILGGRAECNPGSCVISLPRPITARIDGRPIPSSHALGVSLIFGELDAGGRALLMGEAALLVHEVAPFIRDLQRQSIRVSALHNHWLEEEPRLVYVHFQAILNPVRVARALAPTLRRLGAYLPEDQRGE